MAKWNVGEKNGLWKGGKSIASAGRLLDGRTWDEYPD